MTKRQVITAIIKDKRGYVLSVGQNSYKKTHTLMRIHGDKVGIEFKEHIHAEVSAIVKCRDLSRAESIHIFRYSGLGKPLIAKPCPICESAIREAGIKKVFFTVTE